ncbi:MAG TPA: hypothetical protein DCZ91_06400 [Lachnospiraceae bacterium]|nr:hypothetical protein [Lachnospiraceae bacterium]
MTAKLQEFIKKTEDILQQRELISEYGRDVFFRWKRVFYGYRIQNVNPGLSGEGKDHARYDKDSEQAR